MSQTAKIQFPLVYDMCIVPKLKLLTHSKYFSFDIDTYYRNKQKTKAMGKTKGFFRSIPILLLGKSLNTLQIQVYFDSNFGIHSLCI